MPSSRNILTSALIGIFCFCFTSMNGQVDYQKSDTIDNLLGVRPIVGMFPEGEDSLYSFMSNNFNYPPIEEVVVGTVYIEFHLDTLGQISNSKVVKSLHPLVDKEALRLVSIMPNWTPSFNLAG